MKVQHVAIFLCLWWQAGETYDLEPDTGLWLMDLIQQGAIFAVFGCAVLAFLVILMELLRPAEQRKRWPLSRFEVTLSLAGMATTFMIALALLLAMGV